MQCVLSLFCGCCASMCWFARLFPPLLLSLFECTLFFRLNRNRSLCQINCENAMRFLFNTIIYSRQMATNGSNHSPAQDEAHTRIRKREQSKHIRFQSKWINKNAQKKKATTRNYAERHTRRIAFSRVKWKRQSSSSSKRFFIHFWCGRNCFWLLLCDLELHARHCYCLLY